jgi:hypothetical protein
VSKRFRPDVDVAPWKGGHSPYDIVKEGALALLVVAILTLVLAIVFGSPDVPAITIKSWSNAAPLDFTNDALSQLNQTSETATYGAPYNDGSTGQQLGPLSLAKWVGVTIKVNTVNAFVIDPLRALPPQPALTSALHTWSSATASTRARWLHHYGAAAAHLHVIDGSIGPAVVGAGPVPVLMQSLLTMARSGALDAALGNENGFYTTDFTLPLLFLEDGNYLGDRATAQHLGGDQWGMMNETGNYPGQAWLWLYTFWYQIPPFNSSGNGDVLVWALMMLLSVVLLLVPFIPGLRSIPRRTKVYRLIWREHYRELEHPGREPSGV